MNRAAMTLLVVASLACADDARVRELIRDLGDDDASRREQTTEELKKLGDADESGSVERAVEEASRDADAERACRCANILKHVRWWDHLLVTDGGTVDLDNGEFLWRRANSYRLAARTSKRDSWALFRVGNKETQCVDPRSGTAKWVLPSCWDVKVVSDKYLLLADDSSLSRVSLETGERIWVTDITEDFPKEPSGEGVPRHLEADGDLVCESGGSIIAYDAATGKRRWKREGLVCPRMLLDGEAVYVGVLGESCDGNLRRLDRANELDVWKHTQWTYLGELFMFGAPRAGGLFLAGGLGPEGRWFTVALEVATGKVRWELEEMALACWIEPDGARAWIATHSDLDVVDLAKGSVCERLPFDTAERQEFRETVLLADGPRLYVLRNGAGDDYAGLFAFDVSSRTRAWTAKKTDLRVARSMMQVSERVSMDRVGPYLVVFGEILGPMPFTVIDSSTGKVIRRFRPKAIDPSAGK